MDMDAELPEAAAGGIVKGPLTGESRNIEVGADVSEVAEDPSWNPFNNADAKVEAGGGDKSKAQELDSGMAEEKGPLKQPEEEESRTSDAEVGNMEQLSRKEDGVDVPQSAVDVEHLTLDSGTSSSPAPIPSHHVAVPLLNNATPELLRLIDSVIQGSETGASIRLHKLLAEDGGPPYTVANEAVDILLAKMGWEDRSSASHTDGAVPQVMMSAGAAHAAAELLPWLPFSTDEATSGASPRTMLSMGLEDILKACTRNRAMCSAAGLLKPLINAAHLIFTGGGWGGGPSYGKWPPGPLLSCIELLGGHSLSVGNLRELLGAVQGATKSGDGASLLMSLERALNGEEGRGPAYTFEFDGESSGLLGAGESKWPFANGYTFATWLYVESFQELATTAAAAAAAAAAASAATRSGNKASPAAAAAAASAAAGDGTEHMPRLFSFLTTDNYGVETYFHGQFLVVETVAGKGKRASFHFQYTFRPQKWYFIAIEHASAGGSLFSRTDSEAHLYVDGRLSESHALELPRVAKPLAFCCIGTNPPAAMAGLQRKRRQCPLFAEMGPIYIFKEPVGPEKMARLARRGGDYLPAFGSGAGAPWNATNEQVLAFAEDAISLDADLSQKIHLLYHPRLLVGRSCPDASILGTSGAARRPAEVLGHVHIAGRSRPADAIWAMGEGGPAALLPLTIGAIDKDTLQPAVGDPKTAACAAAGCAPLLRSIERSLLRHPGNVEELARGDAPRLLAHLLRYIMSLPTPSAAAIDPTEGGLVVGRSGRGDEELVLSVIGLATATKANPALKVQMYSSLLLDLTLWASCSYDLQKRLLSSLADMVFTEAAALRAANAVQLLLDGCRKCYWLVPEAESATGPVLGKAPGSPRPVGELNTLIDELLVVVELLVGSGQGAVAEADVKTLIHFVVDCPQPNQVARVLHLLYNLIVQPNSDRASAFAEMFLDNGGAEMLILLLRREAELSETGHFEGPVPGANSVPRNEHARALNGETGGEGSSADKTAQRSFSDGAMYDSDSHKESPGEAGSPQRANGLPKTFSSQSLHRSIGSSGSIAKSAVITSILKQGILSPTGRLVHGTLPPSLNLNSITLSVTGGTAHTFRNVDHGDGIVIGVVNLLGGLLHGGHLTLSSPEAVHPPPSRLDFNSPVGGVSGGKGDGRQEVGVWLVYALQKALEAAPGRLITDTVYSALLLAVLRYEATNKVPGSHGGEERLTLYGGGHRFENPELLAALLRVLPVATRGMQLRALQDMLLLCCTHVENRFCVTGSPDWPEWVLEMLLADDEVKAVMRERGEPSPEALETVTELCLSFLSLMLEHSLRIKDGWRDLEAVLHCLEWTAVQPPKLDCTGVLGVLAPSESVRREKREAAVPGIKRQLFSNLLDFCAEELNDQTGVVAAAAAGVAAGNMSPKNAKAEADAAAQLSICLAENALVVLMLLEDFLRSQNGKMTALLAAAKKEMQSEGGGENESVGSAEDEGLPLDVLAEMADAQGHLSAAAMERISASAAAEPYESVRAAFAAYGSVGQEYGEGWRRRSRLWYGVGLPKKGKVVGGGAGWDAWRRGVELNPDGEWVDLPLIRKSVRMLQALLLDDQLGGGAALGGEKMGGIGGGIGGGVGGGILQIMDSDQIFFSMLRTVLAALREEDYGSTPGSPERALSPNRGVKKQGEDGEGEEALPPSPKAYRVDAKASENAALVARRQLSSLLWGILHPLLTMSLSESRRQRVLVAVCILYTEVWHANGSDGKPLRRHFLEAIMPPFTALLRRWRPLLSGIHGLTDWDGRSPLSFEDRALANDAMPLEAAVALLAPTWAATFASPPASMSLAVAAAGASEPKSVVSKSRSSFGGGGGYEGSPGGDPQLSRAGGASAKSAGGGDSAGRERAASRAAAAAAAREKERAAKVGAGRGLGAVALATAGVRRSQADELRNARASVLDSMRNAWSSEANPPSWAAVAGSLMSLIDGARKIKYTEVNRRALSAALTEASSATGTRSWRSLIRRLLETDSLFGAPARQPQPSKVYWKLDPTENSSRQRKRLVRNYKGSDHRGAAADYQDPQSLAAVAAAAALAAKKAESEDIVKELDTPLALEAAKLAPLEGFQDTRTEEERLEGGDEGRERAETTSGGDTASVTSDGPHSVASGAAAGYGSAGATAAAVGTGPAPQMGALEGPMGMAAAAPSSNEKVLLETGVVLVQPLRVLRGRFQITTRRICFLVDEHVAIEGTEDAPPGTSGTVDDQEWEVVDTSMGAPRGEHLHDRAWSLASLVEVHSRRYLLRKSALELFMVDRSNFFFNFGNTEERRRVYKALLAARPPHLGNIFSLTQRPDRLLRRSGLMEKWARREISNFDYLMHLNTLAGRSFNDLTQYPVFPWVLADYTSKVLDLDDPKVYRDLSKPVGALNPARLERYLERYKYFDDPVIPKFHYGSHYSSAGTVLFYLVRVEPMSTLAIQLQGGRFDHADRMFSSIPETWHCVTEDMSDVKELVPELFYLPECLTNDNDLDLGRTQKGERLSGVKLPPWAENPVDFVHKHRQALESEYVSQHLHEWIDLIFGYKQRGKESVAAHNVFFYMTYEGAVDIDNIADPGQRKATQDQITYFGQTPSQLLTVPHIKRKPAEELLHLQTVFTNSAKIEAHPFAAPAPVLNIPASLLRVTPAGLVTVDQRPPACHVALHRAQFNAPDGKGYPFTLSPGRSIATASNNALMRMIRKTPGLEDIGPLYPKAVALPAHGLKHRRIAAISPNGSVLITGGHADNSVKVVSIETARVLESAHVHCAPVTALALSPDGSTLITGSRDATAMVWRVQGASASLQGGASSAGSDPSLVATAAAQGSAAALPQPSVSNPSDGSAPGIISRGSVYDGGPPAASDSGRGKKRLEGPLHVLRGHVDEIVCCAVNADLDLVVTCSQIRGCLLHTIMRGRFIRALPVERGDAVAISPDGTVIIWDRAKRVLRTFTVNGLPIQTSALDPEDGDIGALAVSSDGRYLILGTDTSKVSASLSRRPSVAESTDGSGRRESEIEEEPAGTPEGSGTRSEEQGVKWERGTGVAGIEDGPPPGILLLELHTLRVFYRFPLPRGADVTALALTDDNTNLVVSTADSQLIVYCDPALSLRWLDFMIKRGWAELGGIKSLIPWGD